RCRSRVREPSRLRADGGAGLRGSERDFAGPGRTRACGCHNSAKEKIMMLATIRALLVVLLAFAAAPAAAQDWPTKPEKFIVPFPPGGSVDPLARLLGIKLSESLKQQFIVENKPGASGSIRRDEVGHV